MANNWQAVYEKWNQFESLEPTLREELNEIQTSPEKLEDAFYQELNFGTGGIRGILGVGVNRMNIYTVRKVIQGLSDFLKEDYVNVDNRGVVIAYDSRYMSREFAEESALVLGANGIKAYVFESIRPTPVLSYAVRQLSCAAGIMITASHNPPEYNGLKVYNEKGGQMTPDEAGKLIAAIQKVTNDLTIPTADKEEIEKNNLLSWVGEEVDLSYLERLKGISRMDEIAAAKEKDLQIVYTPLHGTGADLVGKGLAQLNFTEVTMVEEQLVPDPEFSTVESPNPEEHQAFKLAIEYGKEKDADVLLATDPDADRLGAAVKTKTGDYQVLTGNQLGSLLLDYVLLKSDLNIYSNPRMVKTVVTTELGRRIADSYDVETHETLTGFKYIAEKIADYDANGETFMFGYEESYGYLIDGFTRDKDAVQAAVMTAEMATYWKEQGKSVLDALEGLYEQHGYYLEGMTSLKLAGIEGSAQIAHIMNEIREQPFTEVAGVKVEKIENYAASERTILATGDKEVIDLPEENMMKFILEEDGWVCFRPSGTEPKIKYYYGVRGTSKAASETKLQEIKEDLDKIISGILA